jgi:hypothetical protein
MAEAIFRGIVKAGRFCPDDIVKHRAWLARVEGRRVVETIKREQQSRTMSQNRYYWGVVLATLAEWSGHTAEELHGFLRDEFLTPREKKLPSGQSISYPGLNHHAHGARVHRLHRPGDAVGSGAGGLHPRG